MILHIRWNGKSVDVDSSAVGLRDGSKDRRILLAAARHLDLDPEALKEAVVDRTPKGDYVIRPNAVFG